MSDVKPTLTDIPVSKAKTSELAIASAISGLSSFIISPLAGSFIGGLFVWAGLIMGIIALVQISKSNGNLKGKIWAIIGIAPIIISFCTIIVLTAVGPNVEQVFSTINSGLNAP